MEKQLLAMASRVWPELKTMSEPEKLGNLYEFLGVLYSVPLALVGLIWLYAITDLSVFRLQWLTLLLLFILLMLMKRQEFFFFIEVRLGAIAHFSSSFESMITWSAALIFGPTFLWLAVLGDFIHAAVSWRRADASTNRWNLIRNLTFDTTSTTLVALISLTLYQQLGGTFPLPGLTLDAVQPAIVATFASFLLLLLLYAPLIIYVRVVSTRSSAFSQGSPWARTIFIGLVVVISSVLLVELYAIVAAGLYAQNGPAVYTIYIIGVLIVSLLATHLSQAVERSQQRTRELAGLEELGRAILGAPPDGSTLPEVLQAQIPIMFSRSHIEIRMGRNRLFPDQTLLHYPDNWNTTGRPWWEWLKAHPETRIFPPKEQLPWGGQPEADTAVVLAPICDTEEAELIGGIYLSRRRNPENIAQSIPALQSLAAQIASALYRAEVYKIEQEMAAARNIQASFLPDNIPTIPGWQLVAALAPARETSGDFYDFIPLSGGRLGILIADVADKGMGAALYMAAARTLIRTYAREYGIQPELVLEAANNQILADTKADMFASIFYGLLDTTNGMLTYCNAGHNPPLLMRRQNDHEMHLLTKTGMVVGVVAGMKWEQRTIQLAPGDLLVLYTDGVTDAKNREGVFFGEARLQQTIERHQNRPADTLQDVLLAEIHEFVGDAPQFDDITLVVLKREG